MQIPVICVSVLGLLVFMLDSLMSMVRGKTGIIYYGNSLEVVEERKCL